MRDRRQEQVATPINRPADMADGVWMTKAELAALRRISSGSANRLIRGQRWARQRGNDGRTRVLVPKPWVEACANSEHTSAMRGLEPNPESSTEHDRLAATLGALESYVDGPGGDKPCSHTYLLCRSASLCPALRHRTERTVDGM